MTPIRFHYPRNGFLLIKKLQRLSNRMADWVSSLSTERRCKITNFFLYIQLFIRTFRNYAILRNHFPFFSKTMQYTTQFLLLQTQKIPAISDRDFPLRSIAFHCVLLLLVCVLKLSQLHIVHTIAVVQFVIQIGCFYTFQRHIVRKIYAQLQ